MRWLGVAHHAPTAEAEMLDDGRGQGVAVILADPTLAVRREPHPAQREVDGEAQILLADFLHEND